MELLKKLLLSPDLGLVWSPNTPDMTMTIDDISDSGLIKFSDSTKGIIFKERFSTINPLNLEDCHILSKEQLLKLAEFLPDS